MKILYEDNHLIAVYKPHGVLVQGDKSGEECLMDQVKEYLKKKYHKPGNVWLGLLHRLDRPVAGIVLFARTSKGASRLSEQFRNHTVEKIYHALVEGRPKQKKATLVNWLRKDREKNIVEVFDSEVPDSKRAELDYEIMQTQDFASVRSQNFAFSLDSGNTLLKIILKTGRPHQIRAQLSCIGCPIVGDVKYGASSALSNQSIALVATELTFQTAVDKVIKTVTVPFAVI